jgi:hypothetical protein
VGGIAAGTSQIEAQPRKWNDRDVIDAASRSAEVESVDEQPGVAAAGAFDDAGGLRQILRIGPGHELQVGSQAVAGGEIAKRSEAIDQPGFLRVVGGHEQLARAEARGGGDRCVVVAGAGVGPDPEDFHVEHLDPGVRQPAFDLAQQRRVADDVVPRLGRRGRQQPNPDMAEACRSGARHHFGRCQFKDREGGEGNRSRHGAGVSARLRSLGGRQRLFRVDQRAAAVGRRVGIVANQRDHLFWGQPASDRQQAAAARVEVP